MRSPVGETDPKRTTTSPEREADAELAFWPQLTRFYGIPPSELARLPRTIVSLYAEHLRPLIAREQILALEASAYPHLKKGDAQKIARRWERNARSLQPVQHAIAPTDGMTFVQSVNALGIVVEGLEEEVGT